MTIQKNTFILALVILALLGLGAVAWLSGVDSPRDWQAPALKANAATPTITVTPGWWETPIEHQPVPTMPGKPGPIPTTTSTP